MSARVGLDLTPERVETSAPRPVSRSPTSASEDVVRSLQGLQSRPPRGRDAAALRRHDHRSDAASRTGPTSTRPRSSRRRAMTSRSRSARGPCGSSPSTPPAPRASPCACSSRVASDDFDRIEVDLARFELISDPRDLGARRPRRRPLRPPRGQPRPRHRPPARPGPHARPRRRGAEVRLRAVHRSQRRRRPALPVRSLRAAALPHRRKGHRLRLRRGPARSQRRHRSGEPRRSHRRRLRRHVHRRHPRGARRFRRRPEEVGTWSGMARVRDFVMRFDPMEITGTFEGELVHAVAPDDPQVAVVVSFLTDSGQRVDAAEVDPTVPAPKAPEVAREGASGRDAELGVRRLPGQVDAARRGRSSRTPNGSTSRISAGCACRRARTPSRSTSPTTASTR